MTGNVPENKKLEEGITEKISPIIYDEKQGPGKYPGIIFGGKIMGNVSQAALQEAMAAWGFDKTAVKAERYGQGHINDTFCVEAQEGQEQHRYILQRMSAAAFRHPEQLMANIVGVTDYLSEKIQQEGGDPERETVTVKRTCDGDCFFTDREGGSWRVYPFIEDTECLQTAVTPELFEASARAFGRFQYMLRDYPADTLYETIERFHDTENRYQNLMKAIEADVCGRAAGVQAEIEFAKARKADCSVCLQALREGKLPLRVTHNDTKLNNILIDKTSGKGLCIIDLDTVMPGLACNDFGDSIRFGANHNAEDERDLNKVNFDLELFEVYTRGFLQGAQGVISSQEKEYLPWGARLMTLECGMRFLTDYLEGDHYFAVHREGQNLDRCRTQFKLVSDMEKCWEQMQEIVRKY